MKLPKRFTLSTLLLVMLLVSLVFGYAQRRRQWLKSEVNAVMDEADKFPSSQSTLKIVFHDNWFWPTVSQTTHVVLEKGEAGNFLVDGKALSLSEAQQFLMAKADCLRAMGVTHFAYGVRITRTRTRARISEVTNANDLELVELSQ